MQSIQTLAENAPTHQILIELQLSMVMKICIVFHYNLQIHKKLYAKCKCSLVGTTIRATEVRRVQAIESYHTTLMVTYQSTYIFTCHSFVLAWINRRTNIFYLPSAYFVKLASPRSLQVLAHLSPMPFHLAQRISTNKSRLHPRLLQYRSKNQLNMTIELAKPGTRSLQ